MEFPDCALAVPGKVLVHRRYKIVLPAEVVSFLSKLIKDFSADVEPFTFDVEVVEEWVGL